MSVDRPNDQRRRRENDSPPPVSVPSLSALDALLDLLRRRWGWVLGTIAVAVGASAAAAFLMTPIYRAEVVLAPQTRSAAQDVLGALGGSLGGLASLAGIGTTGSAETEYAIAVLRSGGFARSFIEESNLIGVLYAEDWDPSRGTWKSTDAKRQHTIHEAVELFDRKVRTVSIDPQTGIVTLRIEWRDPRLAADWANELARRLNQDVRARTIEEATRNIEYLNAELAATRTLELREVLYRVMETEASRRMLANVNEQYAFRVVDAAMAADPDAPVRPRIAVMISVGVLLGLVLGVLAANMADYRARRS